MSMITSNRAELTAAQHKKLLITQGAVYRLGLCESKNAVRENLKVDTLAKSALHGVASTISSTLVHGLGARNPVGMNFQIILPLLASGISLLARRKSLIRPVLIGAIALAAAAAVIRAKVRRPASTASSRHDRS